MPPSRGHQRGISGISVLKKNGSSVTHEHLGVSPAKEHPTPSKCTKFSWHESSCWHAGMSTLNLSVKALKKPENCLHKKATITQARQEFLIQGCSTSSTKTLLSAWSFGKKGNLIPGVPRIRSEIQRFRD